jgi:hypothetical protein
MKKGDLIVVRRRMPKYIYFIEEIDRLGMARCWRAYKFRGADIAKNDRINETLTDFIADPKEWMLAYERMTIYQVQDAKIRFPHVLDTTPGWYLRELYNPYFNVRWTERKVDGKWILE